ncbi:hypothetical protein [Comamonas sp. JC664]|uniref:hypothetical protein n=1 Tax=Comamonas sp. JC664 TaxID=2801917 RepID=UPI00360C9D95
MLGHRLGLQPEPGISNAVYLFALVMALLGGISVAAIPEDDEEDTGPQAGRP